MASEACPRRIHPRSQNVPQGVFCAGEQSKFRGSHYVLPLGLLCFTVRLTRRIPVHDCVHIFLYTLFPTSTEEGEGWRLGAGLPLGRPLLPPGPPDKIKLQPHTKPPNPHLGQAEAKRPTMFHCYAHHALLLRSVRH